MSYIRCLSNPEGLYVYGTLHGQIALHHNVKPPLSSGIPGLECDPIIVPQHVFQHVCRRFIKYGDDSVISYRGLRVEEHSIFLDTGKRVPSNRTIAFHVKNKRPLARLVRFEYKKQFFYMWRVTWMFVVRNVINER